MPPSIAEAIDRFTAYLVHHRRLSPHTVDAYRRDLQLLRRFLESRASELPAPDAIGRREVLGFLRYLRRDRGNKPRSVARRLSTLRVFFRFLYGLGWVPDDPTHGVEGIRTGGQGPRLLRPYEIDRLLAVVRQTGRRPERDEAIFVTCLTCALLSSELVALNVDDVRDHGLLRVRGPGDEERRAVTMPVACCRAVAAWLAVRPRSGSRALYLNRLGDRLTAGGVWWLFKRYLEAAKLDTSLTVRDLRHTALAMELGRGTSLAELRRLANHRNLASTQRFTRGVAEEAAVYAESDRPVTLRLGE